MKSNGFWVKRWLTVFGGVSLLLIAAGLLKDRSIEHVVPDAMFWSLFASTLFIGVRYSRARRGVPCALCRDTVEE
jgi:uncharacterized membrane protein